MSNKTLKKLMTLLVLLTMGSIYGQPPKTSKTPETSKTPKLYYKVGEDPFNLNSSAALEINSTDRGFLPPRMTEVERSNIDKPVAGLVVWCTDCSNGKGVTPGVLSVYIYKDTDPKSGWWAPFTMLTTSVLTTFRKDDATVANRPVKVSPTSATIKGTLSEVFGAAPTETGIVWREIGNDFGILPVLDASGNAVTPNHKQTGTKDGSTISATITGLSTTKPHYFRTYAISPSGISYGNPVIFNCAPPVVSNPVIANPGENSLLPVFKGKLTVNAGTPKGTITEYGYCGSTEKELPTTGDTKVKLSGLADIADLDAKLDSETFTSNLTIDLEVNNYNIQDIKKTYFRYYVIANGETIYSDKAVNFTPVADQSTGGTAVVRVTAIDPGATPQLQVYIKSTSSSITVHFNVIKAGSYSFKPGAIAGATKGLSIDKVSGTFSATGDQTVDFPISGTPDDTSTDGNTAYVQGIGTLNTGAVKPDVPDGNAYCDKDKTHTTEVVTITSKTGKVWMDRNLGASRAANFDKDYGAYGCLFQWGRGNDGHASIIWTSSTTGTPVHEAKPMRSPTSTPTDASFMTNTDKGEESDGNADWLSAHDDFLWKNAKSTNNPCPSGYRIPTDSEFEAEKSNDKGYGSKVEVNKNLNITLSGIRSGSDGSLNGVGVVGGTNSYCLWSSTPAYSPDNSKSYTTNKGELPRSYGCSVRCIKN